MKFLAASIVFLAALNAGAAGFVIPDTVDLRPYPPWTPPAPSNFIVNGSNDSLIVDSLSVSSMHVRGGQAELSFYLISGSWPSYPVFKGFQIMYHGYLTNPVQVYPSSGTARIAVPPGATVTLNEPGFDHCIACPTAKRAATAAIGDTLKAIVVFHSGSQRDSVLFLSIERVTTEIAPAGFKSPQLRTTYEFYDLTGRRIPASRRVPGFLSAPRR